MADVLLSDGTRDAHPFIKNWFDQFRIATGKISCAKLQSDAKKSECTILHEKRRIFTADGTVREIHHGLSWNEFNTFLCEWKKCANERDTKIERQHQKYALDKQVADQATILANLEAKRSEIRFQIA